MSTTQQGNSEARMPPVVLTSHDLLEFVDRLLQDRAEDTHGYTQSYGWKKSDFATAVDGPLSASRQILAGDVEAIGGWIVAETSGTAIASFRLHDGNSNQGESLGRINLAANESTRDFVPRRGIEVFTGRVFLEVITGSVEGVLIWR